MAETNPQGVPSYGAPSAPQTEVEAVEPAKLGPIGRLTGVLLSPGETFQDINRKPTILVPLILMIAIALGGYYAFVVRINPDWNAIVRTQIKKRMERSSQTLTEDQLAQQAKIGVTIAKLTPVLIAVGLPITIAFLSGIL